MRSSSGAERWTHNPEVDGAIPSFATMLDFFISLMYNYYSMRVKCFWLHVCLPSRNRRVQLSPPAPSKIMRSL